MAKNNKPSFLTILTGIFLLSIIIYSCATMRAPDGGPIDKKPPVVLKMEPENYRTNFNAKKIIITFDEYFKIQNESREFSITPEQEKAPILKTNLKKLEITFQDSLEKNTTYTLNFGNAIADVNESNVIKNLTYVFSTGPLLDSLSISGKVTSTETGKPVFDATVFIIPISRDSIFGVKKAPIFTSTDSSGNYALKNLRKDTYRIYAIKETGGDKIYQQRTDELAYLKDSIVLSKELNNINLALFKEEAQTFRTIDSKLNQDGSINMIFNKKLTKPSLTILDQKSIDDSKIVKFSNTKDSVRMWLQDLSFDSLQIAIKDENKTLDTVKIRRDKKDTYTRNLIITDNTESSELNPFRSLNLYFNMPIESINKDLIKLTEDTVTKTNFTIEKDTTNVLAYKLIYPWKKKASYVLTINENAVTGIFNTKNKVSRRPFKLGSTDDYGSFILRVQVPDTSKQYIVQVLNDRKQIVSTEIVTKNRDINYTNYKVGSYQTRVIYDDNKNGKWDTGNLKLRTQPELIWNIPEERTVRANFLVNLILTIPPPSTTVKTEEAPPKTMEQDKKIEKPVTN